VALVVLVVAIAGVGVVAWRWRGTTAAGTAFPIPGEGARHITAEVLNATDVDGLARNVTDRLRRQGIDVVDFGSAAHPFPDSTEILIRRGDSTAAVAVRRALGTGRIIAAPDAKLLVDVTVLLGADATTFDRHP